MVLQLMLGMHRATVTKVNKQKETTMQKKDKKLVLNKNTTKNL